MDFLTLEKNRYSTRKFSDKDVSQADLDQILEAGRLAPTAKNLQPFKVYVIRSQEGLNKVDQITVCRYGAKTVLLIGYYPSKAYLYPETKERFDSGKEDCAIVLTHMMLEATSLGIQSCWLNRFSPLQAKEVFSLEGDFMPVAMLDLGYEAAHLVSPNHENKKPKEELFEEK